MGPFSGLGFGRQRSETNSQFLSVAGPILWPKIWAQKRGRPPKKRRAGSGGGGGGVGGSSGSGGGGSGSSGDGFGDRGGGPLFDFRGPKNGPGKRATFLLPPKEKGPKLGPETGPKNGPGNRCFRAVFCGRVGVFFETGGFLPGRPGGPPRPSSGAQKRPPGPQNGPARWARKRARILVHDLGTTGAKRTVRFVPMAAKIKPGNWAHFRSHLECYFSRVVMDAYLASLPAICHARNTGQRRALLPPDLAPCNLSYKKNRPASLPAAPHGLASRNVSHTKHRPATLPAAPLTTRARDLSACCRAISMCHGEGPEISRDPRCRLRLEFRM